MSDKRKEKRRHIIYYLKVFNKKNDQHIGHLVDITTEGMKMLSENPIEPGTFFQLKMILPEEIERKTYISFDVKSLWCKRDVNPNYYSIGFEFEDISSQDINIIKNLIYEFSFRD